MKTINIFLGMVMLAILATGCTSGLYTTNLLITRGNSTGSSGSSSADISGDSFFLNIESSYYDSVTWDITNYSGDEYTFVAEPGRHFIITGDNV